MDIVVLDVFWRRCKYDLRKGDYMYVYGRMFVCCSDCRNGCCVSAIIENNVFCFGELKSTRPSGTRVKSTQVFGVKSVVHCNADSLPTDLLLLRRQEL